jgi:hypothetical protein
LCTLYVKISKWKQSLDKLDYVEKLLCVLVVQKQGRNYQFQEQQVN